MLHVPRYPFRRDGSLPLLITIGSYYYYYYYYPRRLHLLLPIYCTLLGNNTHNIYEKKNAVLTIDDDKQLN